jgi:hypothetical protein
MSRKAEEASSFDLFLDTVCNAFGGIVFLAILMALLIQTRSVVRSNERATDQAVSSDEMRDLLGQLDRLSAEHASLSVTLQGIPLTKGESDGGEFDALMGQVAKLEGELSAANQANAKSVQELTRKVKSNQTSSAKAQALVNELAEAKKKVSEKTLEYSQTIESKQQTLTLPVARTSNASSVLALFDRGKIYLAITPSLYGPEFNSDHIDKQEVGGGGIEIRPRPGAGWSIDSPDGQQRIRSLIVDASRNGNIFTLAIWPSAYGAFDELREQLIQLNMPYQLWLQDEDEVLTVTPGSGAATIQ